MRVKKRLRINIALSVTTVSIIALTLTLAFYRVNRAVEEENIIDEIAINAFEREALRSDYMRNGSQRARAQWFVRNEYIGRLLKSAADKFKNEEDRKTIDAIIRNNEFSRKLFLAVVENREKTKPGPEAALLSQETENRLVNQLNLRLYDAVLDARKLEDVAKQRLTSELRLAGWGLLCLIAAVTVTAIINAWTMARTITDRILRLRDGVSVIGGGDLDYRIAVSGDDEFAELSGAFNAMTVRLQESYRDLENENTERKRVAESLRQRSEELEAMNRELEAFVYSISHDLRTPLRSIAVFSGYLEEDYPDRLDEQGEDYLARIHRGSEKMARLIDDLLRLSQVSRQKLEKTEVDLSKIASSIVAELREGHPERRVEANIKGGLNAFADRSLTEIVLSNLLENAWKFTSKKDKACIEFGALENPPLHPSREGTIYYVRDNGAGFDPAYTEKMFRPFHRLHSDDEFEGTGIGLTIVERIVRRHGGRVWAEGEVGKGATVYFTLG